MLLFYRRLRADFSQMLALAVGVLVMTAILAGAPMYLSTIESLGLRSALVTLSPAHRNMQVTVYGLPLTERSVSAATERVGVALDELSDLVVDVGQESRSVTHLWASDPEQLIGGPTADTAILHRFDGFLEHSKITAGVAAAETMREEEGYSAVEAMVPKPRADQLGLGVGDEIWLTVSPVDPPYLLVRITGFFEPNDLDDEFWLGLGSEVTEPDRGSPAARHPLPLFFTEKGLFGAVTGGPAPIGMNRWLVQLDLDQLERRSPASSSARVDAVGHQLRRGLPESSAHSALEPRLDDLAEKISFARIPTLMMGGVLLLAAGYYSIMAAGTLIARRRVDTGRLWARGTGRRQLARIFFVEAVMLVLVPAAVAPFLALGVIHAIGLMPEYQAISLGSGMPVELTWQAFGWSFTGAAIVLAYMQLVVWRTGSGTSGTEQLSVRRVEGRPFFQRQYLDLLFFLFGGVVLWDLSTESSVVSEGADQVVTVNPLLVFAPAIFLAVAVLLSLRVLPPVARLVSGGLARRGPVWSHLVSALFARVPLTYAWPTAILGMAAGTAMLSATVAATLQQSSVDQSGYEAGADLRIFPVDLNSGPRSSVLDGVRDLDGVANVSGGLRTIGDIRLGGQGDPFEFLAIEPAEFARIGAFRDDFSTASPVVLLDRLEAESELGAVVVPGTAARIGVRMRSSVIERNIRASVRLLDANGLSYSIDLGGATSLGWQTRMGKIPGAATRPVEVVGLTLFELSPDELGTPAVIHIDDLMYELESSGNGIATPEVFERFDTVDSWHALASSEGIDTRVSRVEYGRGTGSSSQADSALEIELGIGTDRGVRGVVRAVSPTVPVVFSESALIANNLAVGDRTVVHVFGRSISVEIVGSTELFPTMNPEGGGFVVTDLAQLWNHLALGSANSAGVGAEVFVGLVDPNEAQISGVVDSVSSEIGGLHSVVDRDELRESSVVTPLAVAGWRGASVVTAALAIALALLGLMTFAPLRPANDRFNLSVLRALGVRRRGLILISVIEQLVVLSVGVVAGIGTGLVMARLAVNTASQTDSNVNTLPPIVFSTDWNFVGGLAVSLLVLAVVILVFDVIAVRRIDVAERMRTPGAGG